MVEYRDQNAPPGGPYQWGMVIDLDRCTGCEACVVACYAENNIRIVGEDEAAKRAGGLLDADRALLGGRRVRRPLEAQGGAHALPALRQRPLRAGLSGLRHLSHAGRFERAGLQPLRRLALLCQQLPLYRLRYFNWFSFYESSYWAAPLILQLNPDVTVRADKGVMEKCTFCVQRIRAGQQHRSERGAKGERR
ncbi:MAG: 4Fe-4S binding protein [Candidatus Manganitrophus sp.]|nr:MAG: 4Fe-4S binding protein [Candidatus Manganitrophus sp.]